MATGKQPPKKLKLKQPKQAAPMAYFEEATAAYVDHFKGNATKQAKAKEYLNQMKDGMANWSSSMDMTSKETKKAAVAAKELGESHKAITQGIEKFGKGVKDTKKKSNQVKDILKDLFADAGDSLLSGFTHSANVMKTLRREMEAIASKEISVVELESRKLNTRIAKARRGAGQSIQSAGGKSGGGGGGGLGAILGNPLGWIKSNPGALAGLGLKAAGGLVVAGIGDSLAQGVKLSQELSNIFRANGTSYEAFSNFTDKLPDMIVQTGLSRKELIGLSESFQHLGIPITNSNKTLVGYETAIGKAMKMMDIDGETMSQFARAAYAADLSVSQLYDSLSKMYEHGDKLGLSFADNKQAITSSITSWKELGGILGKSQQQMTGLSQDTTQLFVGLGSDASKVMPFLSSVGSEGWVGARAEQMMKGAGFGLGQGEDLFSGPGMKKYFETALFRLAGTNYGGRNIGVEQNKNRADSQVYYNQAQMIAQSMGLDIGVFREMASNLNESVRMHPELANANQDQIRQFIMTYTDTSLSRMESDRKGKTFDKSFTDHMRTLGQIPSNAMRLVEAGQTKLGSVAMTTVEKLEGIGDILTGGFMDVIDTMERMAPWAKRPNASSSVPPIPGFGVPGSSGVGSSGGGSKADQKQIMDYFVRQGFSPAQAAGFLGNFQQEHGLQTSDAGAAGLGLGQWIGSRKTALLNFAKQTGRSPTDLNTQLDFVMKELHGSENAAYKKILQTKTAKDAADAVSLYYERPGKPMIENREQYALSALGSYSTMPMSVAPAIAARASIPTLAQQQKRNDNEALQAALQSPAGTWFPNLGMATGVNMLPSPDLALPLVGLGPTGNGKVPQSTFDANAANSILQGQLDASFGVPSDKNSWLGRDNSDDLFGKDASNQTAQKQAETNDLLRQLLTHFQQKDQKDDQKHQQTLAQQAVNKARTPSNNTTAARQGAM